MVHKLIAFQLKNGILEINNNGTERENNSFTVSHNNYLFADTIDGTTALYNRFSLIRTVIIQDLAPNTYLVTVSKRLAYCDTVEGVKVLLPYNIKHAQDVTIGKTAA